jgi:hypothetical protein
MPGAPAGRPPAHVHLAGRGPLAQLRLAGNLAGNRDPAHLPQPAWPVSARIVSTIHRAVDGSSVIPVATIASVLSSEKTTH